MSRSFFEIEASIRVQRNSVCLWNRDAVVRPLATEGAGGVDAAVGMMETYALLREDLDNILELAQWPDKPEVMKGVESKVKAAFTRAYNKQVYKAFKKGVSPSVFHNHQHNHMNVIS